MILGLCPLFRMQWLTQSHSVQDYTQNQQSSKNSVQYGTCLCSVPLGLKGGECSTIGISIYNALLQILLGCHLVDVFIVDPVDLSLRHNL